jgi:predicted phosphodiesterase
MRLAVLSDIHGNLTALETALADLDAQGGADHVWFLGDLAAFGPRPAECIRRVFALQEALTAEKCHIIGGNTDRYLVSGSRPVTPAAPDQEAFLKLGPSWQARDSALNWALGQISFEDYEKLSKILGRETGLDAPGYGHVIGYHGTPGDDEGFLRPETPAEEALDSLLDREGRLGIGGHIHVQMDRDLGRWRVVNVGSVGLSFDAPGFAQWGLFTFENSAVTVDLRRVAYDVESVLADIKTVGFQPPPFVCHYLRPA